MKNFYLHQQVGTVCMVIEPDAYTSGAVAGQLSATDNDTPVPVRDADNILFILQVGDVAADSGADAGQLALAYDSAGAGSDATVIDTDSYFPSMDSDEPNEVFLLDLDLGGKGLTDDEGKVFVVSTAVLAGAIDFSVIGIPYGMKQLPSTNENTVTFIGETST